VDLIELIKYTTEAAIIRPVTLDAVHYSILYFLPSDNKNKTEYLSIDNNVVADQPIRTAPMPQLILRPVSSAYFRLPNSVVKITLRHAANSEGFVAEAPRTHARSQWARNVPCGDHASLADGGARDKSRGAGSRLSLLI
jgi:hypothetical protein